MLNHLSVANFAIVDHIELDVAPGMTVLTGETGAGKSILLDALGLALGDRADTQAVGSYGDKAEIQVTFDVTGNTEAEAWLAERELADPDGTCILRRVVGKDGRSRGFINGVASTAADLKTIGETLVDLHSQHEHQSLLIRSTHGRLLDAYGGSTARAQTVVQLTEQHRELSAELARLIAESAEESARRQLLAYQVEELDALGLREGETAALEGEQRQLASSDEVLTVTGSAIDFLLEGDGAAIDHITHQLQRLRELDLPALADTVQLLEAGLIQLEEGAADLRRFAEGVERDPARLAEVEQRLDAIYVLARKHRVAPDALADLQAQMSEELLNLEHADEREQALNDELTTVLATWRTEAKKLSTARKKAAKKLGKEVETLLHELGMPDARFVVSLTSDTPEEPRPGGFDDIEFLISANPGSEPRALARVASGGELSRVSLAIQVVAADTSRVPTLVFDEVDVGIGGGVAEIVGGLLRKLGGHTQVLSVTHQPQVAAQGHQHLQVSKNKARTQIEELAGDERVSEIARMLGGLEMTKQTLAHAGEMLELAQAG